MVVQPCGRGRVKNRPAWRGGGVALTVIRHNCCCTIVVSSSTARPSTPLGREGAGLSGVRSSFLIRHIEEQSRSRSAHATADKKRGWDGTGWDGVGWDAMGIMTSLPWP